ncbi:uncharacterized protein [Argopecten irradians]|uniref:uncharacterized protein n=1 Tax=Argopecten irradians TaxID=31199 RepID=UPI00371720AC
MADNKNTPVTVCPMGAIEETITCKRGTCSIGDGHATVYHVTPVTGNNEENCLDSTWFKVYKSSITILQAGCSCLFVVCYQHTEFVCPSGVMEGTVQCTSGTCVIEDGNVNLINVYAAITGDMISCFKSSWYNTNANSISITQPGCGNMFQVCYERKEIVCSSTQTISCHGKIGKKEACPMKGPGKILSVKAVYSWLRADSSQPCEKAMLEHDDKNVRISEGCLSADVEVCIGEEMCSCSVFGSQHFQKFNGDVMEFGGVCEYVLSERSEPEQQCSYAVEISNKKASRRNGGAYAESLTLRIYGYVIELGHTFKVRI